MTNARTTLEADDQAHANGSTRAHTREVAVKGRMAFHVARSPGEVFDFLADLANESRWNPRVVSMNQVTPGLITTGTRFRGSYRGIGVLVTELVECRRPSRIAFHSRGLRMEITGEFVLSADGGGTDVALEADLRPHGALRVVAPLMAPVFRRQNIAAAERLKKVLETPGRS